MKALRLFVLLLLSFPLACVTEEEQALIPPDYREAHKKYILSLTDAFLTDLTTADNLVPLRRYFLPISGVSLQEYFRRKFGHGFGTVTLKWKKEDMKIALAANLAQVNVPITVEPIWRERDEEQRTVQFTWTRSRGRWYLMSK